MNGIVKNSVSMVERLRGPVSSFVSLAALGGATAAAAVVPVTPDALPETRALLEFFHEISGRYTLTGQHNYPNVKARNSEFAAKYIGHTPVVWGTDFGFAAAGDTDSCLARPDIVQEAIRQHRLGSIIAICWHAVPPTADEPVTFRPLPGADPARLASVQGQLLDAQFQDLLTPGTSLHQKWETQVDAIAVFLKQLEDARVPVLWRPYHEMNGAWFWWGGRTTEPFTTAALYRQIFDRLVKHHRLKNLVWVWSVDRIAGEPEREYALFYPGSEYLDMLALDVYGNDFAQSYYDKLVGLSQGKPLVLAEVGNPPSPVILKMQPRWAYTMTWAGMVRNTSKAQYEVLMNDSRILNLEDPAYATVLAPFRQACGLPPLEFKPAPANFSGTWELNLEKSDLGRFGAEFTPARLDVTHDGNALAIRSTRIVEYADDEVTEESLTLDGGEARSVRRGQECVSTARLSADGRQLDLRSVTAFAAGPPGATMTVQDTWTLNPRGDMLTIARAATTPMDGQQTTLVFERR